MKKASFATLAAVLFLLAGEHVRVEAQAAPDGEVLFVRADTARTALLSGTYDELLNALAPWLKARAELNTEKFADEVDQHLRDIGDKKRAEEELKFLEGLKKIDPDGTLGIQSFDDLKKLTAAQCMALDLELPRLRANADLKPHREARWHQVDRAIFTTTEAMKVDGKVVEVQRTRGTVKFMNKQGDLIVVSAVAEGSLWQVANIDLKLGKEFSLSLTDFGFFRDPGASPIAGSVRDARRSEGEQLLGSARSMCRVQYAKTGSAPKKLSDFEKLNMYEGDYFRVRDTVHKKPDAERGALVVEPIEDTEDGWGVVYFNYAGGDAEIVWYATEEKLDEAIKAFTTAK